MKKTFLIPLLAFIVLAVFLAIGLNRDPREVPSPLVGKPAPEFTLPRLEAADGKTTFSPADFKGQVWLLNVWASWCVSCRQEHPVLVEFARQKLVPIVGLDYKDKDEQGTDANAKKWLANLGNPYTLSAVDADGRVGINYGVYGVPETYLIDKAGVIRMKHIGPVTPDVLNEKIVPMIRELSR